MKVGITHSPKPHIARNNVMNKTRLEGMSDETLLGRAKSR